MLVFPFLLVLTAAAVRRYPYGMSVRVAQFLVPSTLILAAAGLGGFCTVPSDYRLDDWAIPALTVVLVAMGLGRLGHDLMTPYRTPWDRTARDFARWFWDELSVDAELVCVRTDLGIPFRPEAMDVRRRRSVPLLATDLLAPPSAETPAELGQDLGRATAAPCSP